MKRKKDIRFHVVIISNKKGRIRKLSHPTYIFLEKGNIYFYVVITHSKKVKGFVPIKLKRNPNPSDKRDAYFNPEFKEDTKDRFGRRHDDWSIDIADDQLIRQLFDENKNR